MPKQRTILPLLAGAILLPAISPQTAAQVLFSETFATDTSSLWNVNLAATANSAQNFATFAFDYSTIGIPAAPGSLDTRGLKLEANVSGGVQSGLSVSPSTLVLPNEYILRFHLWQNYNGPLPAGGSGSTQVSGAGVGTAGTTAQWAGGVYDSVFFGATGDGGSSIDYRAYPVANTAPADSGFYAAGTSVTPDSRNNADPYYSVFGGQAPPAAQVTLFPQQGAQSGAGPAVSNAGSLGFAWREHVITKTADSITWDVDGRRIATVPAGTLTFGGNNILLNHYDINNSSSSDPNARSLLFGLFDNVNVSVVPEPSSLTLLGVGALAFALRRRRS